MLGGGVVLKQPCLWLSKPAWGASLHGERAVLGGRSVLRIECHCPWGAESDGRIAPSVHALVVHGLGKAGWKLCVYSMLLKVYYLGQIDVV